MQLKNSRVVTFQFRLSVSLEEDLLLQKLAKFLSKIERSTLISLTKKKDLNTLKSSSIEKWGITARQFNSIRVQAQGKISSYKELKDIHIKELKEKIKTLQKRIDKIQDSFVKHQKKRLLYRYTQKLQSLQKENISIFFGGRKLFHQQFNLEKNGFHNHAEWKRKWQENRDQSFFLIGSKDETTGNQTCQLHRQEDGLFFLKLRLPHSFSQKYLFLRDLDISYGKEEILLSLQNSVALNYRYKKDQKGWRVFVSFSLSQQDYISRPDCGVIGVDINNDHLAIAKTDRFGNIVLAENIPLPLLGKKTSRRNAIIGDAVKKVVALAEESQQPIVIETLDFQKKKASLREMKVPYRKMLSSFCYQKIHSMLHSRAFRKKIEVKEINPAYTSIIGRIKFAKKYGLTIHQAAALVIGRRSNSFSELPPCHGDKIPDGKGGYVTFSLPEWNREKHVWSYWSEVKKKLSVAFEMHFRSERAKARSGP